MPIASIVGVILIFLGLGSLFTSGKFYTVNSFNIAALILLAEIASAALGVILVIVGFVSGKRKTVGEPARITTGVRYIALVPAIGGALVIAWLFGDWFRDVLRARSQNEVYQQKQQEEAKVYQRRMSDKEFITALMTDFKITFISKDPTMLSTSSVTLYGSGNYTSELAQEGRETRRKSGNVPIERIIDFNDMLQSSAFVKQYARQDTSIINKWAYAKKGLCTELNTDHTLEISVPGNKVCIMWDANQTGSSGEWKCIPQGLADILGRVLYLAPTVTPGEGYSTCGGA
jgi:hypothetical protein